MGLLQSLMDALTSAVEQLANAIKATLDKLFDRLYPSEKMKKRMMKKYRDRRMTIVEENDGPLRDSALIRNVANNALQEARLAGYEYDTLILTRPQYKELADIPAGATIAEAQDRPSGWAKSSKPFGLKSHKWEQTVYVTHSDAVDGMVLIDSTKLDQKT